MPFRLALAFIALYLLCFSVGTAFYYKSAQGNMLQTIDRSLLVKQNSVRSVFDEFGIEGVVRVFESESNNPMALGVGYHLATPEGVRLAGTIPQVSSVPGWRSIYGRDLDNMGIDADETYRFLTVKLGDNLLSMGRSVRELDNMREHLLSGYFWTFAITTLLALIGGSILAKRSHSRVRSIVSSMDRVAGGNLDTRLPISPRGDDIDNLATNMNDALTLLQQQIRGMQQVSANIAHDLKTPLNRLYIKIEEAAANAEAGKPVQANLDAAIEEAANINGTFEALLRIAQIEAGSRKSKFTAMDLVPTLTTAAEVYEAVAEEHEQTICLEFDKSVQDNAGLHLLGDKDLLLQMVVNIIENAIRHCPPKTDIVISAGVSRSTVWMSVCDNGPGIPKAQREKVFQRLYRLETSRTTKGSGLGLSLVKAVSDLHCGKLSLSNNKPGLCVNVSFDLDCPGDF